MHTTLKFRCPNCAQRFGANDDLSGRSFDCPKCNTILTVPTASALVPVKSQPLVPEILDDDFPPRRLAKRRKRRKQSVTPVELRMPANLGGLKANVDQPTSNAMATTFLGGALVAVGAVLFSMFGLKHKA